MPSEEPADPSRRFPIVHCASFAATPLDETSVSASDTQHLGKCIGGSDRLAAATSCSPIPATLGGDEDRSPTGATR